MCSIPKLSLTRTFTIIASGLLLVGCQRVAPPMADRVNDTPLIVDEAMQKRDWDPSVQYYPNGATVADFSGAWFEQHQKVSDDWRRVTDPAVATGNILTLPISIPLEMRHDPRVYHGAQIPPTYTAQPPLD